MASVTRLDSDGRRGFRIRFYVDKRRRELYIAGVSKKLERMANKIAGYCDELALAKLNNVAPSAESIAWAKGTESNVRENLVRWELVEPINKRLTTDEGRLLDPFCDAYIQSRTDLAPRSKVALEQAKRFLVEYFGSSKLINSIKQTDCENWKRWLLARPLAIASVSKHVRRAKTMFNHAVRDGLVVKSPFDDVMAGSDANPDRQRFISNSDSISVLEACPDADWRLIFSLCRWGGLRCPSEVLDLRWTDIDWDAGRIRIGANKTALRFCPMFEEIRVALEESFHSPHADETYCVVRYRQNNENLRTTFQKIVERAGLVPWTRLFHNLRATRRTELQEKFPDHVINKWLGQSSKVAEKHYLTMNTDHWEGALQFSANSRPPTGSPIAMPLENPCQPSLIEKPKELMGSDVLGSPLKGRKVAEAGIEPARGFTPPRILSPVRLPFRHSASVLIFRRLETNQRNCLTRTESCDLQFNHTFKILPLKFSLGCSKPQAPVSFTDRSRCSTQIRFLGS
jgi:integrase